MADMKLEQMLQELENAAARLAVVVQYEPLAVAVGSGGLCRVAGEYRVIIDKRASLGERVATLARSLGEIDTCGVYLSPLARETIGRYAPRAARG
jgi:hypothetical protein